jgi:hypothetical protein
MNIAQFEQDTNIIAKTSGSKKRTRKITYLLLIHITVFVLIKKDIISSELDACESLLERTADKSDRQVIEKK